jgi:Regulator of G protein signaling domain
LTKFLIRKLVSWFRERQRDNVLLIVSVVFEGFQLFKDYCENYRDEPVPQLKFYEEIRNYEKTECPDERKKLAKSIYDNFIMKEMLSHTHVSFL